MDSPRQLPGSGRGRAGQLSQQDPLHPCGPADAGRGRAAEPRNQSVIASASGHAALRAERVGGELEHGAGVVVQAAHERGVDLVGEIGLRQQLAHEREVFGVRADDVIEQTRRPLHGPASARVLGVKRAQRVQLDSAPDVL